MSKTVFEARYKDVFAVEVKTGKLSAKFLPLYGGRFVSLIDDATGTELLAQEENPHYVPVHETSDYCSCNISAFDDMFPTIDPSAPAEGCRKGIVYDDHGEVCRHPHEYKISDDKLIMRFVSDKLKYIWTKTVSAKDGELVIDYDIENTSDDDFPCIWAGHCMFNGFVGGKVVSDYAPDAKIEMMFDNAAEFGKRGDIRPVNEDMLTNKAYTKEDNNAYKFYFCDKIPGNGVGYYIPQIDKAIMMEFDTEKIPYLGVWMNNGNFNDLFSAALEPCTAGFDFVENAEKHGQSYVIPAKGKVSFSLKFLIK
ncbi:MAG: hypothetical protein E7623_04380 [Ruminococcaceae bacterium]|nr:hypothetical protein [Oscillospiraceae bacterium]